MAWAEKFPSVGNPRSNRLFDLDRAQTRKPEALGAWNGGVASFLTTNAPASRCAQTRSFCRSRNPRVVASVRLHWPFSLRRARRWIEFGRAYEAHRMNQGRLISRICP